MDLPRDSRYLVLGAHLAAERESRLIMRGQPVVRPERHGEEQCQVSSAILLGGRGIYLLN